MRGRFYLGGCLASILLASGCHHAPSAIPSDPIFLSKKPVLSRPSLRAPMQAAFNEPEVPVGPVEAIAAVPTRAAAPVHVAVRSQASE